MAIRTYGTMAVDWERRIDFDRLRRERLARIKELLAEVGAGRGALLRHEQRALHHGHAHRHVGAGQDQPVHAAAAERRADPVGLRLRRHAITSIYCHWLGERSRAGIPLMRGAMTPEMGRSEDVARKIRIELETRGLHKEPLGVDVVEPPVLFALQKEGHQRRRRPAAACRTRARSRRRTRSRC